MPELRPGSARAGYPRRDQRCPQSSGSRGSPRDRRTADDLCGRRIRRAAPRPIRRHLADSLPRPHQWSGWVTRSSSRVRASRRTSRRRSPWNSTRIGGRARHCRSSALRRARSRSRSPCRTSRSAPTSIVGTRPGLHFGERLGRVHRDRWRRRGRWRSRQHRCRGPRHRVARSRAAHRRWPDASGRTSPQGCRLTGHPYADQGGPLQAAALSSVRHQWPPHWTPAAAPIVRRTQDDGARSSSGTATVGVGCASGRQVIIADVGAGHHRSRYWIRHLARPGGGLDAVHGAVGEEPARDRARRGAQDCVPRDQLRGPRRCARYDGRPRSAVMPGEANDDTSDPLWQLTAHMPFLGRPIACGAHHHLERRSDRSARAARRSSTPARAIDPEGAAAAPTAVDCDLKPFVNRPRRRSTRRPRAPCAPLARISAPRPRPGSGPSTAHDRDAIKQLTPLTKTVETTDLAVRTQCRPCWAQTA